MVRGGIFIKKIPDCLECSYCSRNREHGGECRADRKSPLGCLAFKVDPRGCIRTMDTKIQFMLYEEIPLVGTWIKERYSIYGVSTDVKIIEIYGLKWNSKKGTLIVICRCEYYINEYHEDYKEPEERPKLVLIK